MAECGFNSRWVLYDVSSPDTDIPAMGVVLQEPGLHAADQNLRD